MSSGTPCKIKILKIDCNAYIKKCTNQSLFTNLLWFQRHFLFRPSFTGTSIVAQFKVFIHRVLPAILVEIRRVNSEEHETVRYSPVRLVGQDSTQGVYSAISSLLQSTVCWVPPTLSLPVRPVPYSITPHTIYCVISINLTS